ncbi:AAA family ATPase [Kitasatospora sp. NPDC127111]|uniref:AAA family ATPase n=1 Tax=Kitasatospora sp. NPDC127111 TaxID=3345363 RepID=UPI003643E108
MTWGPEILGTVQDLDYARRELGRRFVGRERAIELLQLAVVCREHALLLGATGTAKSALIAALARQIEASRFSYLLTRFTEPAELFGALDFGAFQQGTYRVLTERMLPQSELVFLDEVFQGSSAILNTLLTLLNERRFHNGAEVCRTPLVTLLGASNEIPEDPGLKAFADRFLLRLEVAPVGGNRLDDLLAVGWEHERERAEDLHPRHREEGARPARAAGDLSAVVSMRSLAALTRALFEVRLDEVLPVHHELVQELLVQGVELSDRRLVRSLKLVAGAALLRGADSATPADLWPLAHIWTDPADRAVVEQSVHAAVERHGGAGRERVAGAAELLADARAIADPLLERPPANDDVIIAVLRQLNELRNDLTLHHHQDGTALHELSRIIASVNGLLP